MKAEPYVCKCGSKLFIRYSGSNEIYCKECGAMAPEAVVFKAEAPKGMQ